MSDSKNDNQFDVVVIGTGVCSSLDSGAAFQVINAYALALGRREVLGDTGTETGRVLNPLTALEDFATFQWSQSTK